ncbi:hypothetical protein PVAP13_6NG018383, partial [Panicum virgatum]
SIYKQRAFRRETLLWINFLNNASALLSRSTASNSNSSNYSSLHTTLLFWKVLETRYHLLELGIAICLIDRCSEDSSNETATSLASDNSLTTLQLS